MQFGAEWQIWVFNGIIIMELIQLLIYMSRMNQILLLLLSEQFLRVMIQEVVMGDSG